MSVAQATVTQTVNHPPLRPKYGIAAVNLLAQTTRSQVQSLEAKVSALKRTKSKNITTLG